MKNVETPKSFIIITIISFLVACLILFNVSQTDIKKDEIEETRQDNFIEIEDEEDFKQQEEELENYTELKLYQYKYKNGEIDTTSKALLHYYTYDEKGNEISFTHYTDGEIDQKQVNKYNKANKLTESIEYDTDGNKKEYTIIKYLENDTTMVEQTGEIYGEGTWKTSYKYDEKGNEISFTHYTDGKIDQKINTTYTYNKNGKPDKEIKEFYNTEYSDNSPETITTTIYTYNENGGIEEKSIYVITYTEYSSRTFTKNIIYTYNENGKIEKEIEEYHTSDNSLEATTETKIYTYDKDGTNLYNVSIHEISRSKQRNIYRKYNEKGLLVEDGSASTRKNGERLGFTYKYKYNKKDLRIESLLYNLQGEPTHVYIYEYK